MCECIPGRLIFIRDREDQIAAGVLASVQQGEIEGVSYQRSMDDVLAAGGHRFDRGRSELHLLEVEPGLEVWSAGELQFRYQSAFLGHVAAGEIQAEDVVGHPFADPSRRLVAAPDFAVGFAGAPVTGFEFDVATRLAYSDLLGLRYAQAGGNEGRGVSIAVVDSGLDANAAIPAGPASRSFHDDANWTSIDDEYGHGTAVASVISDIAPESNLTVLKIGDRNPLSEWHLAAAMLYGVTADVMNLSVAYGLGPQACSVCGHQAAGSARSAVFERVVTDISNINPHLIIVAAAGNHSRDQLDFPARFSNVVAVGAINSQKNVATYSNKGAKDQTGRAHKNLFFAPGGDGDEYIGTSTRADGSETRWRGTSFAAPYVSAMLALHLSWCKANLGDLPSVESALKPFRMTAKKSIPDYTAGIHGNGVIQGFRVAD
ncbi:S8 family peptidase (plasmid) [Mycolicibacterium psychrotolerans]|uniref:S8 family peptidase n=1 Tax=Mycolicibacterium psychrotolerans TaxID=216929 RepID=UPI003D669FDF